MKIAFNVAAPVRTGTGSCWLVGIIGVLLIAATPVSAQDPEEPVTWRAGAASAVITPQNSMRMAGYAARTEPSEGTEQDLFGKALAIEDEAGNRVVIVTLDLIGVIDRLRSAVEEQVQEKYQLPPEALLMNASHTHCGPAYGRDEVQDYFEFLVETLVTTIGEALDRLEPASLSYSFARCSVAMNRRTPTAGGYRNHPNPNGPVDHTVPVLSVKNRDGELQSVLFGYACHNTTMGFRRWLGDYAGFAQEYLEEDHPGVTAQFLMGCGGDQNPYPRSELHYAKKHGRSLATSVEAALEVNQRTLLYQHPVRGPLRFALERVDLEHTTADRDPFAYPVQVIRFGDDLTIVALGTEVVVDYSIRLKQELEEEDGPAIWVAGYSNTYNGYIPSKRVLLEGGYEASRPYQPDVEDRIVGKVLELNDRLHVSQ
jgi:neutral ceramidase